MRKATILAAALTLSGAAFAQQPDRPHLPAAHPPTAVEILQNQVGMLAGQSAQQMEQIGSLQAQLAAAQERIKQLEAKPTPPADAAPK